ncbi:unnamed protein product [Symbiodinium microadriaticum]|nr:unnamed protein product [Symbiodinium microadriaticum]
MAISMAVFFMTSPLSQNRNAAVQFGSLVSPDDAEFEAYLRNALKVTGFNWYCALSHVPMSSVMLWRALLATARDVMEAKTILQPGTGAFLLYGALFGIRVASPVATSNCNGPILDDIERSVRYLIREGKTLALVRVTIFKSRAQRSGNRAVRGHSREAATFMPKACLAYVGASHVEAVQRHQWRAIRSLVIAGGKRALALVDKLVQPRAEVRAAWQEHPPKLR